MRMYALALVIVCSTLLVSCLRLSPGARYSRLTGTCTGACDHYLGCKKRRGDVVTDRHRQTCRNECSEVFSSTETLLAFESLTCEDTIGFVEGPSGRAPGDPTPGLAEPQTRSSGSPVGTAPTP